MLTTVAVLCLAFGVGTVASAQKKANLEDEVGQSEKAAKAFGEIMGTPDKAIPKDLLEKAECVAVFPSVLKAGFIVGGQGGVAWPVAARSTGGALRPTSPWVEAALDSRSAPSQLTSSCCS